MDKDKIKHFQTEFKAIVSNDKLYNSIYRMFSKELKSFEPFNKMQSDLEKQYKSLFLERLNTIESEYQVLDDQYTKAYDTVIEKNSREIKLQHRILLQKNRDINAKYQHVSDQIESDRIKLRATIESQISDASKKMQRDLFDIQQLYKQNREDNLNMIDEIEREHKLAEESLAQNYERQKQALTKQFEQINQVKIDAIENNKNSQKLVIEQNNDKYLDIKKTFNDVNVMINQKISELNKSHHQAVTKLDKSLIKLNEPIYKTIEELKADFQQKVDALKIKYAQDLEAADQAFEIVGQKYAEKRERMIKESGEAISIFNSKLTNNREQFETDKLEVIRSHRNEMKDLDEKAKSKINSNMKKKTNQMDRDLNRLIIQTTSDVVKMKRDFQNNLTNEENRFINKRYEWRLNKLLLTNQYHQSLKKLELNYQYNIEFANQKIKLNNNQKESKKDILGHTLNQDVLPLETQIILQNLVQERELNLLNNDQQISLNEFKIELLNIEHAYDIANQDINYLEQKNKQDLDSEMLVLNSNVQLELEKAKIRREEFQKDYNLRSILAQSIFERQSENYDYKYEQQNIDWQYQEEVAQLNMEDHKFVATRQEIMIYQKRSTFMRIADLKTKSRIQQNEALKEIKRYEIDVELQQHHIGLLVESLIFAYDKMIATNDIIDKVYHLPAHPDVFKALIRLLKLYVDEINELVTDSINQMKTNLFTYFEQQASDVKHYKHALRHETFQFFYQNNIDQFDIDIRHFEDEIKSLESTILSEQAILEKQHNFVSQLVKINDRYDKNDPESKNLIKDNDHLIKRHEYIIKNVEYKIKIFEDQITKYHRSINQLSFRKQKMMRLMRFEDFKFNRQLKRNVKIYAKYELYFKKIFKQINSNFSIFIEAFSKLDSFTKQNMYITENQMRDAQNNFMKKANTFSNYIMVEQQKQLKLIKDYYETHLDKEALIIQDIKKHEETSLQLLRDSSNLFDKQIKIFLHKQQMLMQNTLQSARKNFKVQSLIASTTYIEKNKQLNILIKQQEESITKLSKEIDEEIQTINQNQHEIATQYMRDSEDKNKALRDQHEKMLKFIASQNQKRVDDIVNLNDHLDKKNQALLAKFNDQEKQTIQQHYQKLNHIKAKISASHQMINQYLDDYKHNQKISMRRRDQQFRTANSELKSTNSLTTKKEQKQLKADLKEERQSYKFKIKSLHLNK